MRHSQNIRTKMLGFSIIELMIAMTIGLFLLAGIATAYVAGHSSNKARNEFSVLEDNGRLALEILTRAIGHTGYSPARYAPAYQFILASSDVVAETCSDGTSNVKDASIIKTTTDDPDGDSISLVFNGDENIFSDCTGEDLPANCRLKPVLEDSPFPEASKIYSSFYVDNTTDTLMCAGSRNASSEIIAEGIENIQFLYGVDMIDDDDLKADRYIPASLVGTRWNDVVSVQIAVLVHSLNPVKTEAESKQFTLLNRIITTPVDKKKRAVFSTTVHLRNTL